MLIGDIGWNENLYVQSLVKVYTSFVVQCSDFSERDSFVDGVFCTDLLHIFQSEREMNELKIR